MTIYWPDDLPCMQFGIVYNLENPQLLGQGGGGYSYSRSKFTAVPVDFSAKWIMTDSQAVEFDSFYANSLEMGRLWFSVDLTTTQNSGNHFVRFMGGYSFVKLGPDLWEYSAAMQMYLRPGSYALPSEAL